MKRTLSTLFLALLVACGVAQAASVSSTLTVTGTATLGAAGFTIAGSCTLTNVGTGQFASTISIAGITSTTVTSPFTITLSGGTLTGTYTEPIAVLTGSSGNVSATITGGTGTYAGYTGSFPTLAGSSSLSSGATYTYSFSGAGTVNTSGGGTTTPTPTITTIQNNYGNIAVGLPNYGIAPSALFYIQGTALSNTTTALLSSSGSGLQTTVSGVTVTVTANGTTRQCPLYYLSPTQIDAVLPGATPVGNATITVANNGGTSAAFPIVVAQSAFGILSYNGSLGAVYDANYALITSSNAANPNQAIVLWGSGVGYDSADDDKIYPQPQDNLTGIPMHAYVGGVEATITYRGRSQFPGVDQVVLTIPGSAPTGCYVSLVIVSGNIVSNSVTIPIAASGRTCSDSNTALTPDVFQSLAGKTSIKLGVLSIGQGSLIKGATTTAEGSVGGVFESITGFATSSSGRQVSMGSCLVLPPTTSGSSVAFTGLDAGDSIAVTGPAGSLTLSSLAVLSPSGLGIYGLTTGVVPDTFLPSSGGTFTFDNGSGGKDVQHFNAVLTLPAGITWTNASQIVSVNRSQGVSVTWTGGAAGTYVEITGGSTATINGKSTSVTFMCLAPVTAGQFTVPPPVLLSLPAGDGTLSLGNYANVKLFTAPGIDLGMMSSFNSATVATIPFN
jgi:uncharacterized protein (TIGR03437 family)